MNLNLFARQKLKLAIGIGLVVVILGGFFVSFLTRSPKADVNQDGPYCQPLVEVSLPDDEASEEGTDPAQVDILYDQLKKPITLEIEITGTANQGADYKIEGASFISPDKLQINLPADGSEKKSVKFIPIDDTIKEKAESIQLTKEVGTYTGYYFNGDDGDDLDYTIVIEDNDEKPYISISGDENAWEDDTDDPGNFEFRSDRKLKSPVTVSYKIEGSATNGQDYKTISSTISLPAGQTKIDLPIVPIDDTVDEDRENITLTILPSPNNSYLVGDEPTDSITIEDNDGRATVSFRSDYGTDDDPYEVEDGSRVELGLERQNGNYDQPLTVVLSKQGNAMAGDYKVVAVIVDDAKVTEKELTDPYMVTFPADDEDITLKVYNLKNGMARPDASLILTITPTQGYTTEPPTRVVMKLVNTAVSDAGSRPYVATRSSWLSHIIPHAVAAPETVIICGEVRKGFSGEDLDNVPVTITKSDNSVVATGKTDAKGMYSFSDIPYGPRYFVSVGKNFPGYKEEIYTIGRNADSGARFKYEGRASGQMVLLKDSEGTIDLTLEGQKKDGAKEKLKNIKVTVIDQDAQVIEAGPTDQNGKYITRSVLKTKTTYSVRVNPEDVAQLGYAGNSLTGIKLPSIGGNTQVSLVLPPLQQVKISVKDATTKRDIPHALRLRILNEDKSEYLSTTINPQEKKEIGVGVDKKYSLFLEDTDFNKIYDDYQTGLMTLQGDQPLQITRGKVRRTIKAYYRPPGTTLDPQEIPGIRLKLALYDKSGFNKEIDITPADIPDQEIVTPFEGELYAGSYFADFIGEQQGEWRPTSPSVIVGVYDINREREDKVELTKNSKAVLFDHKLEGLEAKLTDNCILADCTRRTNAISSITRQLLTNYSVPTTAQLAIQLNRPRLEQGFDVVVQPPSGATVKGKTTYNKKEKRATFKADNLTPANGVEVTNSSTDAMACIEITVNKKKTYIKYTNIKMTLTGAVDVAEGTNNQIYWPASGRSIDSYILDFSQAKRFVVKGPLSKQRCNSR